MPNAIRITPNYVYTLMRLVGLFVVILLLADALGRWHREPKNYSYTLLKARLQLAPNTKLSFADFHNLSARRQLQVNNHYQTWYSHQGLFSTADYNFNIPSCQQHCRQTIKQTSWPDFIHFDNHQLARWHYEIAIGEYADGNVVSAINFLEKARRLSPEWSFFHLELVNILNQQGDTQAAAQSISQCNAFHEIDNRCQEILVDLTANTPIFEIGIFSPAIQFFIPYPGEDDK